MVLTNIGCRDGYADTSDWELLTVGVPGSPRAAEPCLRLKRRCFCWSSHPHRDSGKNSSQEWALSVVLGEPSSSIWALSQVPLKTGAKKAPVSQSPSFSHWYCTSTGQRKPFIMPSPFGVNAPFAIYCHPHPPYSFACSFIHSAIPIGHFQF